MEVHYKKEMWYMKCNISIPHRKVNKQSMLIYAIYSYFILRKLKIINVDVDYTIEKWDTKYNIFISCQKVNK